MAKILHHLRLVVYIVYPIYIHGFIHPNGGWEGDFSQSAVALKKYVLYPLPQVSSDANP